MVVFSSLPEAVREGFCWVEFRESLGLHVVERTYTRKDGLKVRALAFAKVAEKPREGALSSPDPSPVGA